MAVFVLVQQRWKERSGELYITVTDLLHIDLLYKRKRLTLFFTCSSLDGGIGSPRDQLHHDE